MTTTARTDSSILSLRSPSFWAAAMGMLLGLGMLVFGVHLFNSTDVAMPLALAVGIVGLIECTTSFFTLRAVRVAWAFALSINGTGAVVFLFSAPRIRDAAEVSIGVALLPSLTFGLIVLMHCLKPEDF